MIYCLVPEASAEELFPLLRAHYRGQPGIRVLVERRSAGSGPPPANGETLSVPDVQPHNRRRPVVPRRLADQLPADVRARASAVRWVQRLGPVGRRLARTQLDELLGAVAQGREDALTELYWRCVARVSSRLGQLLAEPQAVDDATRDAFGRLFDELARHDVRDGAFTACVDAVVDAVAAERGG